jgi:hypothetical protein
MPISGRKDRRPRSNSKPSPAVHTGDEPDEVYRVGPGRPPREHQFKPGQSGNPKGAKRKPKSVLPDVKALLEAAMSATIEVKEGDRRRTASRLAIGFEQLALQFARGDRHARRDVFDLAARFSVDLLGTLQTTAAAAPDILASEEDQKLIDAFLNHRLITHGVQAPPDPPDDSDSEPGASD